MGGGGTTVEAPKPSAEERALQSQQTALLQQQTAILQQNLHQQDLLAPFLYEAQGLKPIYGEIPTQTVAGTISPQQAAQVASYNKQINDLQVQLANAPQTSLHLGALNNLGGANSIQQKIDELTAARDAIAPSTTIYGGGRQIVGYEKLPLTEEEQLQQNLQKTFLQRSTEALGREAELAPGQQEISKLLQARSLAALKGELPVDPTVINTLNNEETNLRSSLFQQLGSGYETSTPGIQALQEFNKRKAEVISGANRAELTLGEQLQLARQPVQQQQMTDYLNSQQLAQNLRQSRLGNIFNISQAPGQIGLQGYGQISQGYNAPIQWYANQRQQQMQAQIANAQSDSSGMSAFGSLLGSGITAAAIY